jgi:psp operon transcriptional activator
LDRLSFEVIVLPPLRERVGDVSLLAHLFAGRMAAEMSLPETPAFTPEALEALEKYDWPGNVRELKNVVERAVYRVEAPVITPADLELTPPTLPAPASTGESALTAASGAGGSRRDPAPGLPLAENEFDRLVAAAAVDLIKKALLKARYNQREAAALLGLTYHRFRSLYKKYKEDLTA